MTGESAESDGPTDATDPGRRPDGADPDGETAWPTVATAGLAADGVWKRYDDWVLRDVTLAVPDRGVHVLAGPNGSGKSTLLSLLAGVTDPDRGRVVREGSVGMAFQEPSVHPTLTVGENLSTFGALSGGDVAGVAKRLGLDAVRDRRADRLSGGYRRLLDVALAAGKQPAYLLLDEPLAGLDDAARHRVVSLVDDQREQRAVVVVAHRLAPLAAVADSVTVLVDGRCRSRERVDRVDDLQSWYAERAGLE